MYWLVSLPLVEEQARIWSRLQSKTVYEADLSKSFRFELPELRVGTLDSLMVLSDDLVKVTLRLIKLQIRVTPVTCKSLANLRLLDCTFCKIGQHPHLVCASGQLGG